MYIQQSEDEPWAEVCQGVCHDAWTAALGECLNEDGSTDSACEAAAMQDYVACLMACDDDFFTLEKAERIARNKIERHKRDATGNIADDSFTGIAGEFIADGSYIFVDDKGEWQKSPGAGLDEYARLDEENYFSGYNTLAGGVNITSSFRARVPHHSGTGETKVSIGRPGGGGAFEVIPKEQVQGSFLIEDDGTVKIGPNPYNSPKVTIDMDGSVTATEFIGDGSKLTNLPTGGGGNVNLDEYARLDGATFTGEVKSTGSGFFADQAGPIQTRTDKIAVSAFQGFKHHIKDGSKNEPSILRGQDEDEYGLGFVQAQQHISLLDSSYGATEPSFIAKVNGITEFQVINGTVTAKEFIGDGSKLTNLPGGSGDIDLDEYARLDGARFTGRVFVSGTDNGGCLFLSNADAGDSPTVEELLHTSVVTVRADGSTATTANIASNGHAWFTKLLAVGLEADGTSTTNVWVDGDTGTVTAREFIGDGSKLTNLPTPDLDEYARLDGANFTGNVDVDGDLNATYVYSGQVQAGTNNLTTAGINLGTGNIHVVNGSVTATEFIGDASKLVLTSPNGTQFNLSVADDGTLSATPV